MAQTVVCNKCYGTGYDSGIRYTVTNKTTGNVLLRYAPKEPKFCNCLSTDGNGNDVRGPLKRQM